MGGLLACLPQSKGLSGGLSVGAGCQTCQSALLPGPQRCWVSTTPQAPLYACVHSGAAKRSLSSRRARPECCCDGRTEGPPPCFDLLALDGPVAVVAWPGLAWLAVLLAPWERDRHWGFWRAGNLWRGQAGQGRE